MTSDRWQRIKRIFQTALELRPEARDAYLTAEAGGDSELRREVEKMLRHATGKGVLDRPAWDGLKMESEFAAGARLGPYEILEEAGAGGMGRVYKARDTRLGRVVAIKVLRAEFSHRLRSEGRAISSLNHPHVCALYDIGVEQGTAYLVMEYVKGESLAGRLAKGPLPFDDVLRYGAEVAGALAAAHAQGIVHRDLKPANIMITSAGAKVLDFGVARMAQDELTSAGAVAGTAAYMSPSQLNGNPADARSDIFALGLVLREMAAGTSTARAPQKLAALIERCTCKDSAGRVQSMDEVQLTLAGLRAKTSAASSPRWTPVVRIAALLALTAGIGVVAWNLTHLAHPQAPPAPVATAAKPAIHQEPLVAAPLALLPPAPRMPVKPPSLVTLASYPGLERDPSFSPDGTKVAFSWHRGDRPGYGIFVRPVNEDGVPIQLTEGSGEDWGPAWSPDGRRIAFRRRAGQWGIYWTPAAGGAANLVAPIAHLGQETLPQISWSRDGKWIAAPDRDANGVTQIYLFGVANGERRAVTTDASGTNHAPAFSPDGKTLAYASCAGTVYPCDVYTIDLRTNLRRRITNEGIFIRGLAWLPNGTGMVYSAGKRVSTETSLYRVSLNPPGVPERIDMAGSQARHPAISMKGRLLAYTQLNHWNLAMIRNFR